jgi:hypothetical protein
MNKDRIKSLHSRHNPQAEAERYINSLSLDGKILFFILIEPGFGYMIAPLRKRFPNARIIALHVEKIDIESMIESPDSHWFPETGISLQDFLETEIQDSLAAEIRLLEWRPALSMYGEAYLALVKETVEFLKRTDASTRTLNTFGRRWFRNFFKNLDIIKKVIYLPRLSMPLLVTGAGPGLEDIIPVIQKERDRLFILAAASSVAALKNENIIPNLVISTDGTAWARFHLYELFNGSLPAKPSPVAAALTATLPSQAETLPVMPISDGSFWQTLILNTLKIPHIVLPQRGTVSASALDLALALSENKIFIAGIDLANRDIRSHARPYSLDFFTNEKAERINPVYSQTYKRSSLIKEGGSYDIYASWFKKQQSSYPNRLHSLGKNHSVFSSFETAPDEMENINKIKDWGVQNWHYNICMLEPGVDYYTKAYDILRKALKDSVHSGIIKSELEPLLNSFDAPSLDELIVSLAGFSRRGKNG